MSDESIREYKDITTYGYVKGDKVYLKGYLEFQDREIGVVRESDEQSLQYFVNRFQMVEKKVLEVKEAVLTAENKGSYLMKLIHMRTYLAMYNGLGDFISLYNIINELEDEIREYIAKNREKNYEIKKALLAEAESLKGSTDWKNTSRKLKELKLNWIKTGSAHKEVEDQLTEKFNAALEYFFERRKQFFHEQAKVNRDRFNQYRTIVEQVRKINRVGGGPEFVQRVKDLQHDWRGVGRIARHQYSRFQRDFKRETAKFFGDLKRSTDRKKTTVEVKRELLTEAQNILDRGAPFNISEIKRIQGAWKKLGKQPSLEDKDLNLKFRITCNEIFETHFLERTVRHLNPDIVNKPEKDQMQAKIDLLKESIQKDEDELDQFNYEHGAQLSTPNAAASVPELYQQRNNFINKLKTKHRILKKMEDKMDQISS
ncbi:DUF349 domain-containing protein [Rapidithrix thailandica]|uniref:DUF349 domain-containing protein n=1 Tax=Rapidithrix thailandica TaxID=413964 RepID=A0AAW9S7T6_9BACT